MTAVGYKMEIAYCDPARKRVRVIQGSVSGWERNSPKILGLIILLDKLNGVGGNSLPCDHLRNNPRGDLDTTLVLHRDDGTDHQFSMQLDGGPVFIQVGSHGRHRKGRFVSVFTCQSHGAGEGNPSAPPLSQLSPIPATSSC